MPYIKAENYGRAERNPENPGELNYAMTVDAIHVLEGTMTFDEFAFRVDFIINRFFQKVGISYTTMNAVMGALDCCGRELKRRVQGSEHRPVIDQIISSLDTTRNHFYSIFVVPYEDKKIAENGDVFPKHLVT